MATLGIDIGGTSTKLALLTNSEETVTSDTEAYREPSREVLAGVIRSAAESLAAEHHATLERVGLCVPGPVSEGGVLEAASNVPHLIGANLPEWIGGAIPTSVPATISTDAVAAAIADHHEHPTSGRSLYLALGTGVGGAVLDGGRPFIVTRGTPGHLGHIDVSGGEADAPFTPGAGRGALEAYLGARGLRDDGLTLNTREELKALRDHPRVLRGVDALVRALRIFLAIYRPDELVFMGGLSLVVEYHLDRIMAGVRRDLTPAAPADVSVRFTQAGRYAAAIGAARHAMQ
ncbi:ROK family protein [Mucisphaera calidilacus]|uniref:N-acetyl-D-glucosamine kinase n=1 Tax=Mucisphaera calidilacus TaxID=2527982 RepID=A0A518C1A9_9BACT|nr:ROK family protein [Mucisphaera calidilacus]QDU72984.1 N-acetyl-D-glucosamine kinase [Mucisphaera calidilacus]